VDLIGTLAAAMAVITLALALSRRPPRPAGLRQWYARELARRKLELQQARLPADARGYALLRLAAPAVGVGLGLIYSPVLAAVGALTGLLVPRLYIRYLINAQSARSEREAPKLLQALLANLSAGSTYLEALQAARAACQERWIREDLDFVIQEFLLGVPLADSIVEIRRRTRGRNLALVWDNLAICVANQLPTSKARVLLLEISSTLHFNVQLASEVRARSSGQRAQIWLLALIVPTLFFYLRFLNPDFLDVLDTTVLGRYVLVPAAAFLEALGIVLSFRLVRIEV